MIIHTIEPQLVASGCQPITIGGHWYVFDYINGHYDTSHVSTAAIARAAGNLTDDSPLLLDIETFKLATDYDNAVANLSLAVHEWKRLKPNLLVGLYAQVPERNFWSPIKRARFLQPFNADSFRTWASDFLAWQARNTKNAVVVAEADFVCPSIYALDTRYNADWIVYADANLNEAWRVSGGKPVWPIVQTVYPNNATIPLTHWQTMVELCGSHPAVQRLVIQWAPSHVSPEGWRDIVTEQQTITTQVT